MTGIGVGIGLGSSRRNTALTYAGELVTMAGAVILVPAGFSVLVDNIEIGAPLLVEGAPVWLERTGNAVY